MDFEYCGGLGISAGELVGTLIDQRSFDKISNQKVVEGIGRLAEAVNNSAAMDDVFAEPYLFPRWLYLAIANTNWNRLAKTAGIKPKDLYRKA